MSADDKLAAPLELVDRWQAELYKEPVLIPKTWFLFFGFQAETDGVYWAFHRLEYWDQSATRFHRWARELEWQ